ncbi:MAG: AMP-binding protein [Actinobacteria bacterium]|nr:AMP-binding protein [Actinomycetota bacterium]
MTGPGSLLPRLEAAAERSKAITFVTGRSDGDGFTAERVEWARLHDEARAMAAALQARGIGPGQHVGILGPTTRPLVTAIQATWLAGATVVMLPLPMRLGSIEEFVVQTRRRILGADAALVLADPALAEFLAPEPGDAEVVMLDVLAREAGQVGARRYDRPADDPDALAILQFTSGSTADPKGVMLPHRCVTANLDAIAEAAQLDLDADRAASWLPLYHDMGLIGLLTVPMTTGFDLVLAGAQDFLAAPSRWMQWMSDFRCTVTGGPNFAYALAARALRRLSGIELGQWRLALNGAEPIDPDSVEAFLAAGAPHGLGAGSAFCVYGMAEATLAITFPEPGSGMAVDPVDRRVLETDRYAAPVEAYVERARRLPLLGRTLRGIELRVVDPVTGDALASREVGEIELRGDSITPGYYRNERATTDVFHDGWLRTGDLGYTVDGELVVCGRIKDVIIMGGRNVFPEDVERAATDVDGVRAGNVIAFGAPGRRGREAIVVVAETKADDPALVRDAVATRVTDAVGVPPEEVILVRPGSIPKTSSGKLQRSLCKARYLGSVLEPV